MNCTDSPESDAALGELIAKYHDGGAGEEQLAHSDYIL